MDENTEQNDVDEELTSLLSTLEDESDPQLLPEDDLDDYVDPELESILDDQESSPDNDPELQPSPDNAAPADAASPTIPDTQVGDALVQLAVKVGGVADKVLADCETDRFQLEGAIRFLGEVVQSGGASSAYVESWVSAMRTKADINIQRTKLVDSVAKLLGASKNNDIMLGVDEEQESYDLEAILRQPAKFDELDDVDEDNL